jgi:CRISPR-associated protein Csh1
MASSKMIIHSFVEGIYPSRLSELDKKRKTLSNDKVFGDLEFKKGNITITFTFRMLKSFFPEKTLKEFLATSSKVLKSETINYNNMIKRFISVLRDAHFGMMSKKNPLITALNSFYLLCYFYETGNLNYNEKRGSKVMSMENNNQTEKIEEFFERFNKPFGIPEKKGVFLMGVLCKFLLNIQYQELKNDPFMKKIKGLKMRKEDIIKLYPSIINKLEEYKKNYFHELESIISSSLLEAGDNWQINSDEINYYFALGLSLYDSKNEDGSSYFRKDFAEKNN